VRLLFDIARHSLSTMLSVEKHCVTKPLKRGAIYQRYSSNQIEVEDVRAWALPASWHPFDRDAHTTSRCEEDVEASPTFVTRRSFCSDDGEPSPDDLHPMMRDSQKVRRLKRGIAGAPAPRISVRAAWTKLQNKS